MTVSAEMADFIDPVAEYLEDDSLFNPPENGPNSIKKKDYTGKDFIQDIYHTLNSIGGVRWLIQQAQSDPRAFMGLLKGTAPKNLNIEQDTNLSVQLVDRFGSVEADWTDRQNAEGTIEYVTPLLEQDPDIAEYLE